MAFPKDKRFAWYKYGTEFRADMPGNITLVASPDRTSHFGNRAARGTTWHAQASHWDEPTRTMSRYGADEYHIPYASAMAAKTAAERIYTLAQNADKKAKLQEERLRVAAP